MTKHSQSCSLFLLTENEAPQDARYSRQESIEVRPLVPKGFVPVQLLDKLKFNPFSFQIGTFRLEIAHQILQHSFLAHSGQDEIY